MSRSFKDWAISVWQLALTERRIQTGRLPRKALRRARRATRIAYSAFVAPSEEGSSNV